MTRTQGPTEVLEGIRRLAVEAALVLEDGSVWRGRGFGGRGRVTGEVVFNTGMAGYTESLTDPSYRGQILCQTFPLIGNYGVSPADFESSGPQVRGYVVSQACTEPSHSTSRESLPSWLARQGIPGIEGLDTRALTKRLRAKGVMLGVLETSGSRLDLEALAALARDIPDPNTTDLVAEVTTAKVEVHNPRAPVTIALLDCGAKESIVRSLVRRKVRVVRLPAASSLEQVLKHAPRGVVISNGPGDPQRCKETILTVRGLLREKVPLFGICLGNQILALAAGGRTYKLKFGHRGQNQPCLEEGTERCYITSQNHGYAVDARGLPEGWKPWFTNANDGTNEGLVLRGGRAMGVQFHPEANPGPTDTEFLFDRFLEGLP
jgi:carbamoyl-phosphate synthase small subunit